VDVDLFINGLNDGPLNALVVFFYSATALLFVPTDLASSTLGCG
jgi:hypothetical protein